MDIKFTESSFFHNQRKLNELKVRKNRNPAMTLTATISSAPLNSIQETRTKDQSSKQHFGGLTWNRCLFDEPLNSANNLQQRIKTPHFKRSLNEFKIFHEDMTLGKTYTEYKVMNSSTTLTTRTILSLKKANNFYNLAANSKVVQ